MCGTVSYIPMAYWTMNVGFDTSNRTDCVNGEFVDYASGQTALLTSKRWLQSAQAPTPTTTFTPYLPANSPQKIPASNGDDIWVRVFPKIPFPNGSTYTCRITVVFGRKPGTTQPYRAPFVLQNATFNASKTVIDTQTGTPTWPDGSFLVELGNVVNSPTAPNTTYQFVFIVGVTVWVTLNGAQTVYTFGHDPEMDVTNSSSSLA
jgi:hypothetical protein